MAHLSCLWRALVTFRRRPENMQSSRRIKTRLARIDHRSARGARFRPLGCLHSTSVGQTASAGHTNRRVPEASFDDTRIRIRIRLQVQVQTNMETETETETDMQMQMQIRATQSCSGQLVCRRKANQSGSVTHLSTCPVVGCRPPTLSRPDARWRQLCRFGRDCRNLRLQFWSRRPMNA